MSSFGATNRVPVVLPQGSQRSLEHLHGNFYHPRASRLMGTVTKGVDTIKEGKPPDMEGTDGSRWVSVQKDEGGPAGNPWKHLAERRLHEHSTALDQPSEEKADRLLANPGKVPDVGTGGSLYGGGSGGIPPPRGRNPKNRMMSLDQVQAVAEHEKGGASIGNNGVVYSHGHYLINGKEVDPSDPRLVGAFGISKSLQEPKAVFGGPKGMQNPTYAGGGARWGGMPREPHGGACDPRLLVSMMPRFGGGVAGGGVAGAMEPSGPTPEEIEHARQILHTVHMIKTSGSKAPKGYAYDGAMRPGAGSHGVSAVTSSKVITPVGMGVAGGGVAGGMAVQPWDTGSGYCGGSMPMMSYEDIQGGGVAGSFGGKAKKKRRAPGPDSGTHRRGQLVKEVKERMGFKSMIEASKYVAAHGLWKK